MPPIGPQEFAAVVRINFFSDGSGDDSQDEGLLWILLPVVGETPALNPTSRGETLHIFASTLTHEGVMQIDFPANDLSQPTDCGLSETVSFITLPNLCTTDNPRNPRTFRHSPRCPDIDLLTGTCKSTVRVLGRRCRCRPAVYDPPSSCHTLGQA